MRTPLAIVLLLAVACGGSTGGGDVKDCADFATQPQAQRYFEEHGGPAKDPSRLDADKNGKACEELPSGASSPAAPASPTPRPEGCDPSYPDICVKPPPPDLDCKDIPQKGFAVRQPDPHRLDQDRNGIGCEP
jgi:hypothetical protein